MKKDVRFLGRLVVTLTVLVPLLALPGCALPGSEKPALVIFAGSASKPPLDELARAFESQRGVGVEITYGGSGTVLSQMMLARTGDLYIPGSQDFMDTAEAKGAVDPSTRKIIAYLVPAIAVPKGNPKSILTLADLAGPAYASASATRTASAWGCSPWRSLTRPG